MTRKERAMDYFKEGYNCTQAVVLAFADLFPLEKEQLLRIASPFGGGMGRLREVCGAVSGMLFVVGQIDGYDDAKASGQKKELYAEVQELAKAFEAQNRSIVCRELLGLTEHRQAPTPEERTKEYYRKRPCAELVGNAVEILEQFIAEKR